MDIARQLMDEEYAMASEDDKYYTVAGIQFERDRKYTLKDYNELIPDEALVELINGVFYDMYPVKDGIAAPKTRHQRIVLEIAWQIKNHIVSKNGKCDVFIPSFGVVLKDDDSTYVLPDVTVVCDPDKITDEGCQGAPDWIAEVVSPGNPGNDYVRKLNLYYEAGVREYWIVDPDKNKVFVYDFTNAGITPEIHELNEHIKVGIYDDLYIDLSTV